MVHRINAEEEHRVDDVKYPSRNNPEKCIITPFDIKLFDSFDDINSLDADEEYGVKIENGICFNEGLQNRQDAAIRMNIIFGTNMWCTIDEKTSEKINNLVSLGIVDEFGIFHPERITDENKQSILSIFND